MRTPEAFLNWTNVKENQSRGGGGALPVQQLVEIVYRQREHDLTLAGQNFGFARRVLRQVLVEHVVNEVANLNVAPDQHFELGAPRPTHVVELAQAGQQGFVAASQSDVVKYALGDLVAALVEEPLDKIGENAQRFAGKHFFHNLQSLRKRDAYMHGDTDTQRENDSLARFRP